MGKTLVKISKVILMDTYSLLSITEAIYIIYMYNHFKTNKSIHHPLEMAIQKNIEGILKHPVKTGKYQSKIGEFGKLSSYGIAVLIFFRNKYRKSSKMFNTIVVTLVAIVSFILNMNAFVYLTPVFLLEIFYFLRY